MSVILLLACHTAFQSVSLSSLDQVMSCRHSAPSHYLILILKGGVSTRLGHLCGRVWVSSRYTVMLLPFVRFSCNWVAQFGSFSVVVYFCSMICSRPNSSVNMHINLQDTYGGCSQELCISWTNVDLGSYRTWNKFESDKQMEG